MKQERPARLSRPFSFLALAPPGFYLAFSRSFSSVMNSRMSLKSR